MTRREAPQAWTRDPMTGAVVRRWYVTVAGRREPYVTWAPSREAADTKARARGLSPIRIDPAPSAIDETRDGAGRLLRAPGGGPA